MKIEEATKSILEDYGCVDVKILSSSIRCKYENTIYGYNLTKTREPIDYYNALTDIMKRVTRHKLDNLIYIE